MSEVIPKIPKGQSKIDKKFIIIGLVSIMALGSVGLGVSQISKHNSNKQAAIVEITSSSYNVKNGAIHGFLDSTYTFEDGRSYVIPADTTSTESVLVRNAFTLPSFINDSINASIGENIVNGFAVSISEGIVEIGNYSFANLEGLKMMILPYGLRTIGGYSFTGTINLADIQIPDTVVEIGDQAFYRSGLTNISIPKSVMDIGTQAFAGMGNLTTVVFEGDPSSIPAYAFSDCDKLESISIPEKTSLIGNSAFANCSSLKRVYISDAVTEIKEKAFANTGIESLTLPSSVTMIGNGAFSDCENLRYVELAEGMKTFDTPTVFSGSTNIETVIIPSTLTKISAFAFSDSADSLKEIIVYSPYLTINDFDRSVQSKVTFLTNDAITQANIEAQKQEEEALLQKEAEEAYQEALLQANQYQADISTSDESDDESEELEDLEEEAIGE